MGWFKNLVDTLLGDGPRLTKMEKQNIGNERHQVYYDGIRPIIIDSGKEFTLYEFSAGGNLGDRIGEMIQTSVDNGGDTMVASVNGRVIVTNFSLTAEETMELADKSYSSVKEAYQGFLDKRMEQAANQDGSLMPDGENCEIENTRSGAKKASDPFNSAKEMVSVLSGLINCDLPISRLSACGNASAEIKFDCSEDAQPNITELREILADMKERTDIGIELWTAREAYGQERQKDAVITFPFDESLMTKYVSGLKEYAKDRGAIVTPSDVAKLEGKLKNGGDHTENNEKRDVHTPDDSSHGKS